MAAPTPDEFKALVPMDLDNPTCEELKEIMVELPKLTKQLVEFLLKNDGTISDELALIACALDCDNL